jgi:drug/metabolite transporter (DMT)-like permease
MTKKRKVFNWQFYFGLVLIVTGGLFLADQLLVEIQIMRFFWPLLIVFLGVTFFVGMLVAGKRGAGLAIPGTITTAIGLLLFIQNTFKIWVTWTYAWGLLISAVGLGLLIMNFYLKQINLRRVAGLLIGIGLLLFVIFGVLFEVILNISGTNFNSGMFLGGGLVALGLFVIFSRPLFSRRRKQQVAEEVHFEVQTDVEPEEPLPVDAVFEEVEEELPESPEPPVEEEPFSED